LLGVQSLWEGVDFPGAALEILVVAKLPFSVPDDPWCRRAPSACARRGLDPFRADSLPEAVLRFRQGIGRLIRAPTIGACWWSAIRVSPGLVPAPVPATPAGRWRP
jgi:ATP-dependent DNA helicase DinG